MSKATDRIECALDNITGSLPADNFLEMLKEVMLVESVFKTLFGDQLERISISKTENQSVNATPYLRLRHKTDSFQSADTYNKGSFEGVLLLPPSYRDDSRAKRKIALIIFRFFISNNFYPIFEKVSGLTDIENLRFDYSRLYKIGQDTYPSILFTFDYVIDLHRWQVENPEVDLSESLDGSEFDMKTIHIITEDAETSDILIDKELLWESGDGS